MAVRVYSPALPSVELFGAYEGIASATRANEIVSITFTPTEGNLTVVPYDGDYSIRYLQLEPGSIPTSYIPTSGSQGARAEDVLTIPDAPWPEAVTTGPELVTNGTFDTDTSGWTGNSNASISLSSNRLRVTNTNSGYGAATAPISVVAGKVYVLYGEQPAATSAGNISISQNADGSITILSGTVIGGGGSYTGTWTSAITGTVYVSVRVQSAGVGNYSEFDNISVKEISTRAIGISMKGLMTYADTNSANELNFLNQEVGSDQISYRLRTDSTRDGALSIFQRADGVLDTVATASDSVYFPGINVPFSIASRHGDSFLNGAVDGTAMSENTTPTILPDLSATPIAIRASGGPLYIEEMRIWVEGAVDKITDALIEEASA